MIKDIKKLIERKIKELGFNFDPKEVFKKEMIRISYSEEESRYFPTYECTYYSSSQELGVFDFRVRFYIDNCYTKVDLENLRSDMKIHIVL